MRRDGINTRMRAIAVVSAIVVLVVGLATIALSATRSSELDLSQQFANYEQAALANEPSGAVLSPDQQRAALFDAYRSLVPADDPAALRDLNAQYEALFSQIGFVASPVAEKPSSDPTPEHEETGINNDGEDLPGFQVNNRWTGKRGDGYITVFAGASVDQPSVGAVEVFINGEPFGGPVQSKNASSLTIQDATDGIVVLTDEAGNKVTFDLRTLQFG